MKSDKMVRPEYIDENYKHYIPKEWLNTEEAAYYLGLSSNSLLNMVSNGQVKRHKLGTRNRYKLTELRALFE
jgi:excisionase family DNA binding protein